jgi:hypothetical protein
VPRSSQIFRYDFEGNFKNYDKIIYEEIGSFAWHPIHQDIYYYTPMNDSLVSRVRYPQSIAIDSALINQNKEGVTADAFYRTLQGNLLFQEPFDLNLNIYELSDSVWIKYIFDYGLDLRSFSRTTEGSWSTIMADQGIWALRVILENEEWLYICLRSQRRNDPDFTDLFHLVYHKESQEVFRLPGHMIDDTYFGFGFWLDDKNYLSLTINPYQISNNPVWLDAFDQNQKEYQEDGNPIVVKLLLNYN